MSWALGGVKPWVAKAGREVGHRFGIATILGLGERTTPGSDHPKGLALDFMTTHGQGLADYVKANAGRLGVTYVIWHQHIWSVARSSEGWRLMEDRGSPTANHMDHVHVSFQATAPAGGGKPATDSGSGSVSGSQSGSSSSSPAGSGAKHAHSAAHTTATGAAWLTGAATGALREQIILAGVLLTGVALIGVGAARVTRPLNEAGADVATLLVPEAKAATTLAAATTATKGK